MLPGTVVTNARRKVTARVVCTPLRQAKEVSTGTSRPAGDIGLCRIVRTKSGRITVTVLSPPVRVTLTLSAPGTKDYRPYLKIRSWVVR